MQKINLEKELDNLFCLISNIRNVIKSNIESETKKEELKYVNEIKKLFADETVSIEDKKAFIKLYVDYSKTLFNFITNNAFKNSKN